MNTLTFAAALAIAALLPRTAPAQDPEQTIRKILEEVSEEMQEIDRLLLQSSRKDAAGAIEQVTEKIQKLLDQTQTSQGKVVRGIDQLIEELQNMQSNSQSQQGQQGSPRQRPGDSDRQQDQRQQGQRQENDTPDIVQQQQEQDQNSEQPGQDEVPEGGHPDPKDEGANRRAGKLPEDGTEHVDRNATDARWGSLPAYLQFVYSRGGVPDVPEKYRRLLEAYQKASHKQRKN